MIDRGTPIVLSANMESNSSKGFLPHLAAVGDDEFHDLPDQNNLKIVLDNTA